MKPKAKRSSGDLRANLAKIEVRFAAIYPQKRRKSFIDALKAMARSWYIEMPDNPTFYSECEITIAKYCWAIINKR